MRSILLLLCFSFRTWAQSPSIFRIDSLSSQSIPLDKHWRWQFGDSAVWATPQYNHTQWDTINLSAPIATQSQLLKSKIAWFRLLISVDSSACYRPIGLLVKQAGASEVYLDGTLIAKFGKVSTDSSLEKTAFSTTGLLGYLYFNAPGKHVLAVRYSYAQSYRFSFGGINGQGATFESYICKPQGRAETIAERSKFIGGYNWFLGGVFFTIGLLHLILYWYNRSKIYNRTFAITLFMATVHFVTGYYMFSTSDMIYSENLQYIYVISIAIFIVMLSHTVIDYIYQPKSVLIWLCSTIYLVSSGFVMFSKGSVWLVYIYYASSILLYIETLRLTFKAKKKGNKDAQALLISFIVLVTLLIIRVLIVSDIIVLTSKNNWINLFMIAFYLCVPLSLSILIAKGIAKTEVALKNKLKEVETLSSEKQQILANQNETLERQVTERTAELKASQAQLIQSEKLASLGELTAGIAHEIQNPLNFVNNFSELSVELISELKEERSKEHGKRDEELENELLNDLARNQEKINLHGKRASSIVKGMLEHSRASTGVKELTDINQLADEYLRLSYHGMRAKDKSFQADYKLIADENLPKINVIPQDMGRVLLNLMNNAFYAVNQRNTVEALHATSQSSQYQPTVTISTHQSVNHIIIKIQDNGTGMPESVKTKIFQPFFTTKPTGEGTGLGLSLAYDIVTKGHGGTIEVESMEGEGTTFTVKLPILT